MVDYESKGKPNNWNIQDLSDTFLPTKNEAVDIVKSNACVTCWLSMTEVAKVLVLSSYSVIKYISHAYEIIYSTVSVNVHLYLCSRYTPTTEKLFSSLFSHYKHYKRCY